MSEVLESKKDNATYGVATDMLQKLTDAETNEADVIDRELLALSPRTEIDDQGLSRLILEHDGITFSFAGRQETPRYATLEQSRTRRLGHERWEQPLDGVDDDDELRDRQAYRDYMGHLVALEQQNTDAPEHLLTETSPLGIYSLLAKLQPTNPKWPNLVAAVTNNEYSDEALRMIDMVTGVNALYEAEHPEASKQSPIGEALVVQALLGNQRALAVAEQAAQKQAESEAAALAAARFDNQATLERYADVEAFRPSELAVVRISAYEPQVTEDGYEAQTAHDASGYPRATLHTTLNHIVESHMWGNWDDKDYVLVADFEDVLQANGSPKSLNGADTWWTRDPGETLQFPKGTLVAPGGPQLVLMQEAISKTTYKSENITQQDIEDADTIFGPGARSVLLGSLRDEDGNTIDINSDAGQRILANGLRDLAVRREITEVRGKKYLPQSDEKYMPTDISQRLSKMAAELDLTVTGHLHEDSNESYTEDTVGRGSRRYAAYEDPKVRRVAYASGFMGTGGRDRMEYLQKQLLEDEEGD